MEEKFYSCGTCGNLLFAAVDSGVTPFCCGKEMTLLKAKEEEEYGEKHKPVVTKIDCNTIRVTVGSVLHPMTEEHCIRFICVQTTLGMIFRCLTCDEKPDVTIKCNGIPKAVYAYCNLHGLWRTNLERSC